MGAPGRPDTATWARRRPRRRRGRRPSARPHTHLGQKVADLAADVIGGKSVEKNTTLEGQLVTKDNVKDYAQHLVSIGDAADAPANLK